MTISAGDTRVHASDLDGVVILKIPHGGYTLESLTQVGEHVAKLSGDSAVDAIVIEGTEGEFCVGASGALLDWLVEASFEDRLEMILRGQRNVQEILASPKLIVAHVNGFAAGAGVDLLLACDRSVATSASRANFFYSKLGVVPDHGGTYLLADILGWRRALETVEKSPSWGGDDLLDLGLCQRDGKDGVESSGWRRFLRSELRVGANVRANLKRTRWIAIRDEFRDHLATVAEQMSELLGDAQTVAGVRRVNSLRGAGR